MSRPWRLRGYVVERLLGTGATGEVWRARVAATGEPVALKRLAGGDGGPGTKGRRRSGRHQDRLHTEAALLSALEHPHLIRLHGVEHDADGDVLVLDLADGGSLADVLRSRGRLTPGEVITALLPIASALAYAHAQGVVHGDVSAGNILFTAAGVPLLADLGVGRLVGDDVEIESTPSYVDPAVAVGCVPGPSGDVFMLGGVALHALTGVPTWPGDAATALAAARTGELGDIAGRLAAAGVPEPVAAVVRRALSPDSLDRGTAAEFALDLRHSGTPVAVELRAGRSRRDALVHAAREAAGNRERPRGGRHAAPDPGSAAPKLPWRAIPGSGEPSSPPPTASVRPRPRPRLPRHRRIAPAARRVGLAAGGLALVAGLVGGALWLRGRPAPAAPERRVAQQLLRTRSPAPVATSVASQPSEPRAPQRSASPAPRAEPVAALRELAATRSAAFEQRRPALLARVYGSPRLLRADQEMLASLVPAGCRLSGLHTSYRDVEAVAQGAITVVTAVAVVGPSQLRCRGRPPVAVPAAAPTALRIRLVRTRDGPRIAAERRVSAG